MTIYISKYIHVEVPDYEVEIEIEPEEVLSEMDCDDLLEHMVNNCDAEIILSKLDTMSIIEHLIKRDSLPRLLRRIAEGLESVG
jgi:hypothetical protein